MKFCKDCKHYLPSYTVECEGTEGFLWWKKEVRLTHTFTGPWCRAPKISPVTGQDMAAHYRNQCWMEREDGECGPDAKLFEAKD